MSQATEFHASDFIFADLFCGEVNSDGEPRNRVLLDPKIGHEEAVDDILAPQDDLDLAIHRHCHDRHHDVVLGRGVIQVQAQGISGRFVDQLGIDLAKNAVQAGVAELPLKLGSGHFHLKGARGCTDEVETGPRVPAENGQPHEQHRRGRGPQDLQFVVPVRIFRLSSPVAKQKYQHSQCDLRENENDPRNAEGKAKLRVDLRSNVGDGFGKPPFLGCYKPDSCHSQKRVKNCERRGCEQST